MGLPPWATLELARAAVPKLPWSGLPPTASSAAEQLRSTAARFCPAAPRRRRAGRGGRRPARSAPP
eukprot:8759787-Lingulodinium_polyedra.AAC.1